jgi:hypothetical protein
VDDTTPGTTNNDVTKDPVPIDEKELTSDEEAMVKRMEDIIPFFLDLLQVTGGHLSPEKCVWYLIRRFSQMGQRSCISGRATLDKI